MEEAADADIISCISVVVPTTGITSFQLPTVIQSRSQPSLNPTRYAQRKTLPAPQVGDWGVEGAWDGEEDQ